MQEQIYDNVGTLINGNCLDYVEKLTYDYIITSPPDFDEIGEDPNKSTVLWEQLMHDTFLKANPKNGVITIILRDRKAEGTVKQKHNFICMQLGQMGWVLKSQKIWVRSYKANLYRFNYSFILTFKKKSKQSKDQGIPDVLYHEVSPIEGYVDNYPPEVLIPFVNAYTSEEQTVYDPFMGSGSTAVACVVTGRKFVGTELVNGVYDISRKRLTKMLDDVTMGYQ
jgi:DNA modification methylase